VCSRRLQATAEDHSPWIRYGHVSRCAQAFAVGRRGLSAIKRSCGWRRTPRCDPTRERAKPTEWSSSTCRPVRSSPVSRSASVPGYYALHGREQFPSPAFQQFGRVRPGRAPGGLACNSASMAWDPLIMPVGLLYDMHSLRLALASSPLNSNGKRARCHCARFRVPDRGSGNPTPLGGWDRGVSSVKWLDGSV
jgi:hypothetical protein